MKRRPKNVKVKHRKWDIVETRFEAITFKIVTFHILVLETKFPTSRVGAVFFTWVHASVIY